jgi:hypothetical protein
MDTQICTVGQIRLMSITLFDNARAVAGLEDACSVWLFLLPLYSVPWHSWL